LAEPALAHRLIISPAARMKNVNADDVLAEILDSIPVPGTPVRAR
jgi:MoxR-like ATPase